jgi:3-hydroxyacyl-[acyl-carrier-protein] dehydratase
MREPIADFVFDQKKIKELIPHRDPFLFVDTVIEFNKDKHIKTSWYVPHDHIILQVHFPNFAVVPGVILIEALAQSMGIFTAQSFAVSLANTFPALARVSRARFYKPVRPDDTVHMNIQAIVLSSRLVRCHGESFVGDERVCSAELTAVVIQDKEGSHVNKSNMPSDL